MTLLVDRNLKSQLCREASIISSDFESLVNDIRSIIVNRKIISHCIVIKLTNQQVESLSEVPFKMVNGIIDCNN